MIRAIQEKDFLKMPWKNGRGFTQQIFITPPTASVAANDFDYRISSATVDKDGEFSLFPGKKRILVAVKGHGFQLNDDVYEKFEVAQFTGDEKIFCALLGGPVVDLGLIYDESKVKVNSRVLDLRSPLSFEIEPSTEHFFIIMNGSLNFEGVSLKELETLYFKNEKLCNLQTVKRATLLYLSLDRYEK